jgi:hypothetical protein
MPFAAFICVSRNPHFGQMSMSKPVGPNMATATPLGPPRAQIAQKQHAGLLELDAQPSATSIRLPHRGRSAVGLCPGAGAASSHPDTYEASGPNQEPGRILIPGDGAAGDQGAENRPACGAIVATRRLRPVPSQRFLPLRSQAHTPPWSRQVTSTSIRMVKPGPLALLAVTHRQERTPCLWLEQFQIDALMFVKGIG